MDTGTKWEIFVSHINTYQNATLVEEVLKTREK